MSTTGSSLNLFWKSAKRKCDIKLKNVTSQKWRFKQSTSPCDTRVNLNQDQGENFHWQAFHIDFEIIVFECEPIQKANIILFSQPQKKVMYQQNL